MCGHGGNDFCWLKSVIVIVKHRGVSALCTMDSDSPAICTTKVALKEVEAWVREVKLSIAFHDSLEVSARASVGFLA